MTDEELEATLDEIKVGAPEPPPLLHEMDAVTQPAPDAAAIREAALREAAAVATNLKGNGWDDYPPAHPYDRGYVRACEIIAERILALITEKPHDR